MPGFTRMGSSIARRPRPVVTVLGAALLVVSSFIYSGAAVAHTPTYPNYTRYRWPNYALEPFNIRREFPSATSAAWYARITSAAQTWNDTGVDPAEPDFSYAGETTATTPDPLNPCSIAWSGVYWRAVGGLGQTQTCRISGTETILSFSIVLNSGANFYTGTGTPGTGQYDALSVATHEFGHAAGLGHFADTDPSTCNPAGGRLYDNTMCGSLPVRFTTWRSLELHDRHTFQAAYPY
jgi:hypothetical protein